MGTLAPSAAIGLGSTRSPPFWLRSAGERDLARGVDGESYLKKRHSRSPRSSLAARRSPLAARRSALAARRSALGARRSSLGAQRRHTSATSRHPQRP